MNSIVEIENGTWGYPGQEPVVRDLNWTWQPGETWAVCGDVGQGKSSFLNVLMGRLRLAAGTIRWPLLEFRNGTAVAPQTPVDFMVRVGFKEESRLFSHANHYYQQRYDFADDPDIPTLDRFLRNGLAYSDEEVGRICATWHLEELRSLSVVKLSNGQMRRARLARALLRNPEVLLLDEPTIGLDTATRWELDSALRELVAAGQRILVTAKPDGVPEWATNVLELGERNRLPERVNPPARTSTVVGEPIIECRNVRVSYGVKAILDGIDWTVRRGERWALLGPNGSGKTTLLSLICGDHPQAYSNDIALFGRKRGSGENIWDIRRRIGFVSPELHLAFNEPLTGYHAAGSGFHDVLVRRPLSAEQASRLDSLFDYFGVDALKERYFARMSTGEQRMILLLRALVKGPELLVLDEPFQGLDATRIARLKEYLENRLRDEQTLIFVSHVASELPGSIDRVLRLTGGRIDYNYPTQ